MYNVEVRETGKSEWLLFESQLSEDKAIWMCEGIEKNYHDIETRIIIALDDPGEKTERLIDLLPPSKRNNLKNRIKAFEEREDEI